MKKFQFVVLLTVLMLAPPSFVSAGLVISTTNRPSDDLVLLNGTSVSSGQAPFVSFTLASPTTIDSIELHGGGFGPGPAQFSAFIYLTPGHNPFTDMPDATTAVSVIFPKMTNSLAQLSNPLTSSFFEVFFVMQTGQVGGVLSDNHGPLHSGTTTGVFYGGRRVDTEDKFYVALYGADIRPTPEPATVITALVGLVTASFLRTRRTRR